MHQIHRAGSCRVTGQHTLKSVAYLELPASVLADDYRQAARRAAQILGEVADQNMMHRFMLKAMTAVTLMPTA